MPSKHLILCNPLLLPSIFPSIRIFPNESDLHIRWLKYWSFSFRISPSDEYSGLISFKIGWFHLLAVREILNVFSNPIVWRHWFLWHSAFFIVQVSHPYMTTGKNLGLLHCRQIRHLLSHQGSPFQTVEIIVIRLEGEVEAFSGSLFIELRMAYWRLMKFSNTKSTKSLWQ